VDDRDDFEAWHRRQPGYPYAGQFLNIAWSAFQEARVTNAKPIGYMPAYELGRLQSGHDANLRSAKFGPSHLDGDVPVYVAPQAPSGQQEALSEAGDAISAAWQVLVDHGEDHHERMHKARGILADAITKVTATLAGHQSERPAPPSVGAVYSATLKTRAQMRKAIPDDQRGWYYDVACGQTLLLREANHDDMARCTLNDSHSKNPADWLCEVFPRGSLVDRRAVASMHVEEGICVAPAALASSQAERPAEGNHAS
jgi:hypothetical protein